MNTERKGVDVLAEREMEKVALSAEMAAQERAYLLRAGGRADRIESLTQHVVDAARWIESRAALARVGGAS